MSGFKKMYLVDPKRFHTSLPFQDERALISGMSHPTPLDQMTPLRQRITHLDHEMDQILRDKTKTDEDKLRQYLETLRKHILSRKRLDQFLHQPLPVRIIEEKPEEEEEKKEVDEKEGPPTKKRKIADISTLTQNIPQKISMREKESTTEPIQQDKPGQKEALTQWESQEPYGIKELVQMVPEKYRQSIKYMLKNMKEGKITWDKQTGIITTPVKVYQDTNIADVFMKWSDGRKRTPVNFYEIIGQLRQYAPEYLTVGQFKGAKTNRPLPTK